MRLGLAKRLALTAALVAGCSIPAWPVVFATTRINNTFVQVTGTRTELVQQIEPQLALAGWTTISGTGTGDVVMESANPAGAVPAIRVRLLDTAANCASIIFRNVAGTQVSNTLFLLPAAAKTWRVVANEFQFFVFSAASATPVARNFVAGGIPAVASFLAPSVVWWGVGDASSDTDATTRETFRLSLTTQQAGCGTPINSGQQACNYDGTLLDGNSNSSAATGALTLLAPYYTAASSAVANQFNMFADGSYMVSDAYLGWGIAGVVLTSPLRYIGTMYDAIVVSSPTTYDTTVTFNGNNYWVVTNQLVAASCNPGVLAVRVP